MAVYKAAILGYPYIMPPDASGGSYANLTKKKRVVSRTRINAEDYLVNTRPTKEPKLDWPGIVAELHRRGMTLGELSSRIGLTRSACGKVKDLPNYKAQQAIADIIDEKPEDLWPSRYPKGGPRILDTKKYPPVDSQKANASADKSAAA